jgi:hypothetical protein
VPHVGRRTALAGALGGIATTLLATGCDTGDDLRPPGATTSPSGSLSPSVTTATPSQQTPDEALVDQVTAELTAALVTALHARRAPGLRQLLAPLVRAHRAHIEVLDGSPPATPAGAPPSASTAVRQVRRTEQRLQASLAAASGRADSGALAKLLASMSASVTQHLAVLPEQA